MSSHIIQNLTAFNYETSKALQFFQNEQNEYVKYISPQQYKYVLIKRRTKEE